MSTGPGPTRKPDGTSDASVDDIADLLVEDDAASSPNTGEVVGEDSLDVMLETPGPALANPFMPPPPSPMGDSAEEGEGSDDNGGSNLAYEDLLAKLVLPAKGPEPEPEPEMPAVMSSLPMPEPPTAPAPTPLFPVQVVPSLQSAPPAEERTLVTENPLVAEEQEAAVREGRLLAREQSLPMPVPVHAELRSLATAPVAVPVNGATRSRLFYLVAGGLLVLGGMLIAVILLKVILPSTPTPPATTTVAPTPPLPPPPAAPPAKVEPLPPSAPSVAPTAAEPSAAPAENDGVPAPTEEVAPTVPKPHKVVHAKTPRPAAPKPASVPKAATPKVAPAPAPAPKPAKVAPAKKSKTSGYADPFDN